MNKIYQSALIVALALASSTLSVDAASHKSGTIDLWKLRYQVDSPSPFHNARAKQIESLNAMIEKKSGAHKAAETVTNPKPIASFAPSNTTGNIDAPNGELWYFTGEFDYLEIPAHDNVWFTDKILQSYSFEIYDANMKYIGTIKDKMDYQDDEVRVPQCELAPIATRNFFNTDDKIELVVSLAVNIDGGGNHYRSVVYSIDGKKDADGDDEPVCILDDFIGDVAEAPSTDGTDNYYMMFMSDVYDWESDEADDNSFWSHLLAQKAKFILYGKAVDDKGPRVIYESTLPLVQIPGDQENIAPFMSMRLGDEVIYSYSYYKEPFYNRYDTMMDDMTQREGNSLMVELYKANENGLTKFSTTEIPVVLDPMPDKDGNPTCLFSYYSVGSLRYTQDILFDAPGASHDKPDFIVTRGNYQVSTDGVTNSYFTYTNAGELKNTLFIYADGTVWMSDIEGFEPQQMFVSKDSYGYLYNFVDIYSAKTVTKIEADYYYDDDADPELLTTNVARYPVGNSYNYAFELRYPLVDDDENDILRFMHIDPKGKLDHTDYVNMGKGVAYAQSFLSTEALAPHAYSTSDTPAYMFLVKRGAEGSETKIEQLMVAEAESEVNPDGKTLLLVGPNEYGVLASVVPEFAVGSNPGRLFVYYYDSETDKYELEVYHLPLDEPYSGISDVAVDVTGITLTGSAITAEGLIYVYGLDGSLVAKAYGSVDVSALNAGVYVVNAGSKALKFVKR